ncbi:MAG: transporter substrate-binding domain-containing protein [Candidatus Tectomicrobia bacterium]|nr:transporter substrate-binding domain-containing protein [Candidatus Tectomicrobia bacterium]
MRQRVSALRSPGHLASTIMRWGFTTGSLGALLCAGLLGLFLSAPATSQAQQITNPLHGNQEAIEKGYNLYHRYCSICHGTRAKGAKGPSLRDEVWTWGGSDTDVFTTIVAGRPNTLMGAFGARVQPMDIWSIIAYLRTEYRGALYDAKEKGVLTVCAMPNQLPASDKNSGGFNIALAEEIAGRMGLKTNYVWAKSRRGVLGAISTSLVQKHCDMFMGVPVQPEPIDRVILTEPYLGTGYTLVRGAQASEVQDVMALADRTTAVPLKSDAEKILIQSGYDCRPFASSHDALQAVHKGDMEVAMVPAHEMDWWLKNQPESTVEPVEGYVSDPNLLWNVAIGVRKNDHDLREVLNVVLGELAAEQRVPQLMSQYGVSYTPPWGEDRS